MSPDEIFAAHMWPWPDPLIKRDGTGRIIFINAAFLQMYGGRVEDWRGNTVVGWPAPQNTGAPFRFETRITVADGEHIYDWIEYSLADGSALALARDVTALITPQDPPPGNIAIPETPPQNTAYEAVHETAAAQAPLAAHANTEIAAAIDAAQAHIDAQPAGDWDTDIEVQAAPNAAQTPENTAPIAADPVVPSPAENITESAPTAELPPADPVLAAPEATEPYVEVEENVRDHERRALPIENGDAVLGNNWRDAVIAKAVGADVRPDDTAETPDMAAQDADSSSNAPAPQAQTTQPSGNGQKTKADLRILLAEDNAINALLTRTLLEAEGCSVDVVEDGELAVEAVKNAQYDMIFMDMRMPNMDGLESTRKIRALPNIPSQMPIVALTANAFDDDRNACFDSGMNDFMTKPVSAEELSQMVETWALKTEEQRLAS